MPGRAVAAACAQIGGFADLGAGEDRDLIRRMRLARFSVRHASDVQVFASCRLTRRAPGGMAQALRDRLRSARATAAAGGRLRKGWDPALRDDASFQTLDTARPGRTPPVSTGSRA